MKKFPFGFISVLMMPTDYCNMNCVYCFHERKAQYESLPRMSPETLEKTMAIILPFYEQVKFIWHGGEPTAMGIDFFRRALSYQLLYNTNGVSIANSIQTNLTLMDEELARFFVNGGFHVGSSHDGTRNHLTRHNSKRILEGRDVVLNAGGQVGFICVVQSNNVDYLIRDYSWFKQHGINYTLNMYQCFPPREADPLYVPVHRLRQRICELFDHWFSDTECRIRISYFNDFVDYMLFAKKSLCSYNSCMGKHVGIQHDGTISACNRIFPADYSFGSVHDYQDIRDCFESSGFQKMAADAVVRRSACKETCALFAFCEGGCNSTAYFHGDIKQSDPESCELLKCIYHHVEDCLASWKNRSALDIRTRLNPAVADKLITFQKSTMTKTKTQ